MLGEISMLPVVTVSFGKGGVLLPLNPRKRGVDGRGDCSG